MKRINYILLVVAAALLCGCETNDIAGIFNGTSPHANERFSNSMEWNNAHGYTTLKVADNYKVYVAADTHIESGKDEYWKRFVNDYKSDKECPFAIHLGDMINGKEQQAMFAQDLAIEPAGYVKGSDTIFTVTGNHDIYFNQWGEYLKYYHTSSYYVDVQTTSGYKDLYIFIDSGSGTLGTDQTEWLRQLLDERSQMGYRHIIISTHTNFYQQDMSQGTTSNFALEETYTLTAMFTKYKVSLVLTGHDHFWEDTVYGGVRYLSLDCLRDGESNAAYFTMNVGSDIKYGEVKLN